MQRTTQDKQDGEPAPHDSTPNRPTSYPGWDGPLPRHRATLVLMRDDRVLLVRDRGRETYALPGGGIEDGELPIVAAARELHEETGLEATAIRYLFTYEGKYNDHHMFEVEADGEVVVSGEVDGFTWWDMEDQTPVYPHVRGILGRLNAGKGSDR